MKLFFSVVLLSVVSLVTKAQIVIPSVLNSAGQSAVVNNIYFDINIGESFTSTIMNNNIITQGLLQPDAAAQGPLPVTGLVFVAKRTNQYLVTLNWNTQQEINNLGFYIERKKDNESSFTEMNFVPSKAINGNSVLPLFYTYTDANDYNGKTYYRLKQKDIDGKETYSELRVVDGSAKNEITLKVWPVPAIEKVNVLVSGIDKAMQVQVLDAQAKLVNVYTIKNETPLVINGLASGVYILRLSTGTSSVAQKIVMQ